MRYLLSALLFFSLQVMAELPENSIYQVGSQWTNQLGKPMRLQDFQGKFVVVSMVYMSCRFSCPMTVAKMKEVEKNLNAEIKDQVQFVLVSFDLKNDTPEVMQKFATKNHLDPAQWTFLAAQNESSLREFSTLIDFQYKSLASGEFEHSYAIIALDPQGRIIGRTEGSTMNPKQIAELLK